MFNRNVMMCLLSFCLLISLSQVAFAVEPYQFDLMWPQTWGAANTVTGPLNNPGGVATDSAGTLYVADTTNNRIIKISRGGAFITQWGSSGTSDGQFNLPRGVAVDLNGNVYVADYNNNRIQKFGANGNHLLTLGGLAAGSGNGQFNLPRGVAVDGSGNLYIADTDNNRIQKFDANGIHVGNWPITSPKGVAVDSTGNIYAINYISSSNNSIKKFNNNGSLLDQWSASTSPLGYLYGPYSIGVDNSGNVYISEMFANRVRKFSSTGTQLAVFETTADRPFSSPQGIAIDGNENVYVADSGYNRIQKFQTNGAFVSIMGTLGSGMPLINPVGVAVDSTGTHVYVADGLIYEYDQHGNYKDASYNPIGSGELLSPTGLAVDISGNIYVADTSNGVKKFSANGVKLKTFAIAGDFNNPTGVAVDSSGNVFIADAGYNRIVKCTSAGDCNLFIGGGDGSMIFPYAVAVDTAGNIYVADLDTETFLGRVQKFDSSGNMLVRLISHSVEFDNPHGLAVDSSNNVYVAENGNRIQKFASNGSFITTWGTEGSGAGQFELPQSVAVDVSGNVYVADTGNIRIQKFFPSPTITMTVSGYGTVASSPAGISCPSSSCSSLFYPGSPVTLTASPIPGAGTFQSWGGDCSSCSGTTCLVTMNSSKTCSATFVAVTYPLNVTISGNGSVHSTNITPAGQSPFSCNTTGACTPVLYQYGTVVRLNATSSTDYKFYSWSLCQGTDPCDVTILGVTNLTATFAYVKPVRVILSDGITQLNADGYDTLSSAYAVAPTNSTIQARTFNFLLEPQNLLNLTRGTTVSIRGGFDETFTTQGVNSIFKGVLKINSGSLSVNHLVVQQP